MRGTFGIFTPGVVQLRERDSSRILLERPAGPLEPVAIDDDILLTRGPLDLVALDSTGALAGRIAQAEVT